MRELCCQLRHATLSNGTYMCTSARLREASTSIRKLLDGPNLEHLNNPRTGEMLSTIVDPPIASDFEQAKTLPNLALASKGSPYTYVGH